jgi:hypothetical protein
LLHRHELGGGQAFLSRDRAGRGGRRPRWRRSLALSCCASLGLYFCRLRGFGATLWVVG